MSRHIQRADPNSVRRWNEFAVITALRELSPQRISSLTGMTGLTPAPLAGVLRGLVEKEWVDVIEPTPGGMGRPAQQFALHVPDGILFGLDIGGHCVRGVTLALTGEVLGRVERLLPQNPGVDGVRAVVAEVVRECLVDAPGPVWLTGIAMTGFLDLSWKLIACAALPEWEGLRPVEVLEDLLPSRALALNDIRAAAIAELKVGAAQGIDDFVLIHLGRRPALGLVIDGVPRRGSHGVAGDMTRNAAVPLEVDLPWLHRFADSSDPLGEAVSAAVAGDEEVLAGVVAYVDAITPTLTLATSLMDPQLAVIAGALAPASEHFVETLTRSIFASIPEPPPLVVSPLDEYAAAHGAAFATLWFLEETLANQDDGALPFTLEELDAHPLPSF